MKSIFKLYVFKPVILSLIMIFISFGANAITVEQVYKNCKPYQNNGFTFQGLGAIKIQNALVCMAYLTGLAEAGYSTCDWLNRAYKRRWIGDKGFKGLATLSANGSYSSINQVITSFINYAESNSGKWKYSPYNYTNKFIGEKFPCRLDK